MIDRCLGGMVAATLLAAHAPRLAAQDSDTARRVQEVCFRGRPLPACKRFVVLEMDVRTKIARTSALLSDVRPRTTGPTEIGGGLSWRAGLMVNRDDQHALGGVAEFGFASGTDTRFAASLRRRTWTDDSGTSWDLDAGALVLRQFGGSAYGVTTGAAFNVKDLIALTANLDVAYGRHPQAALLIGARLGSYAAVAGTAAVVALAYAFVRSLD